MKWKNAGKSLKYKHDKLCQCYIYTVYTQSSRFELNPLFSWIPVYKFVSTSTTDSGAFIYSLTWKKTSQKMINKGHRKSGEFHFLHKIHNFRNVKNVEKVVHSPQRDLNSWPLVYETSALTTELRRPVTSLAENSGRFQVRSFLFFAFHILMGLNKVAKRLLLGGYKWYFHISDFSKNLCCEHSWGNIKFHWICRSLLLNPGNYGNHLG